MFQDLWAYFRGPSRTRQTARGSTRLDVESLEDRLALSPAATVLAPHGGVSLVPKRHHSPHRAPHLRPHHPVPAGAPAPGTPPPATPAPATGKRVAITLTGLGPTGKDTLVIPPEETSKGRHQGPLGPGHKGALFEQGGDIVTHDGWITLHGADFINIPRDGSLGTTFDFNTRADVDIHLYAPIAPLPPGFDELKGFVIPADLPVGFTGSFGPLITPANEVFARDFFRLLYSDDSPSRYADGGRYKIVKDVNDRRYVIISDNAGMQPDLVIPRDGSAVANVPLLATTGQPDRDFRFLKSVAGGKLPDPGPLESELKREEAALAFSATLPPRP
jgi:hypothetical protein